MEDSKSIVQVVEQHFNMNVEEAVDSRLKSGIHSLFVGLIASPDASKEEVRHSIIRALDMLAKVLPNLNLSSKEGTEHEELEEPRPERDEGAVSIQAQYFSGQQGGMVEFFINSVTKKYDVQVNNTLDQTKRLSSKEKRNDMFKTEALATLASFSPNSTETLLLSGVLMSLELAEGSEGLFKDVFKKYSALFNNLRRVYSNESMQVLGAPNDSYSPWFTVDEAIAKYDQELEKEAEWRMRMG